MRFVTTLVAIVLSLSLISCAAGQPQAASPSAAPAARAANRVLVLVDASTYEPLKSGLETYFADVRREQPVEFKVLAEGFYAMKPPAIRAAIQKEYDAAKRGNVRVVGAIMVGPIPIALRGGNEKELCPCPMYYEDFEAEWVGPAAADGVFTETRTDRFKNATELWTAWWVPPSDKPQEQTAMLKAYLEKLHKYHQGQIDGTDSMLFLGDERWNQVELGESWTVLMKGALESTGQKFVMYSSNHEAEEHTPPANGKTFTLEEFRNAWASRRWQHSHSIHHGAPNGFYWVGGVMVTQNIDLSKFDQTGANIVTASGCSNGNFRDSNTRMPHYAGSIGNALIFSPRTITVTYFGAAASQSVGTFASYHTQLFESLDPARKSYIGEGYYNMRNTDHVWGTTHYLFRGCDEKVLLGDPFARYHMPKNQDSK